VAFALDECFRLLDKYPQVLIAGVDSLLNFATLQALYERGRILSADNSNGFIPGEGACALLVGRPDMARTVLPRYSNVAAFQPDTLDFSRAASNARKGIETSIVLDLNILSKMNDVVVKTTTYAASGLESLVKFINKLPLVLSPGFALNEADKSYIETLWDSWEMFLWEYCPTYVDTPNATKNKVNQGSERRFELLSRTEQHFFLFLIWQS
jgi:hypothetical protein